MSIAQHVGICLDAFRTLIIRWSTAEPHIKDKLLPGSLTDELGRFRIWSGNIGAHKKGNSSLDYRLREASHIQERVINLLKNMLVIVENATEIIEGNKTPWEDVSDSSSDGTNSTIRSHPETCTSELAQLLANIAETTTCLMRLSIAVRTPAPHDQFKASKHIDLAHFEAYDIQHVRGKFPHAQEFLITRLGRAISRRRQYLRYREEHHERLGQGLPEEDELQESQVPYDAEGPAITTATRSEKVQETVASSIPGNLKHSDDVAGFDEDDYYEDAMHDWFNHEVSVHLNRWECMVACGETFQSSQSFNEHMRQAHIDSIKPNRIDEVLRSRESQHDLQGEAECVLCKIKLSSYKRLRHHLGKHQEELSLFAIPTQTDDEAEDVQSNSDHVSIGSTASSESSSAFSPAICEICNIVFEGTPEDSMRAFDDHVGEIHPGQTHSSFFTDEELYRTPEVPVMERTRASRSITTQQQPHKLKSILRNPTKRFPEESSFILEGVAPHKDDIKGIDIPPEARWTRIDRKLVNPEALKRAKERFEERSDSVTVLRVLTGYEIQQLADLTKEIREKRENVHKQHHSLFNEQQRKLPGEQIGEAVSTVIKSQERMSPQHIYDPPFNSDDRITGAERLHELPKKQQSEDEPSINVKLDHKEIDREQAGYTTPEEAEIRLEEDRFRAAEVEVPPKDVIHSVAMSKRGKDVEDWYSGTPEAGPDFASSDLMRQVDLGQKTIALDEILRVVEAHGGPLSLADDNMWGTLGFDLDLGRELTLSEVDKVRKIYYEESLSNRENIEREKNPGTSIGHGLEENRDYEASALIGDQVQSWEPEQYDHWETANLHFEEVSFEQSRIPQSPNSAYSAHSIEKSAEVRSSLGDQAVPEIPKPHPKLPWNKDKVIWAEELCKREIETFRLMKIPQYVPPKLGMV
ncbi:hypothetical protein N0V95_006190 [Ascochyta clinopodiicola]|nr:hypothetical protein N0V95_006190 [Ascochyta clinopodiicola]